MFDGNIFDFEPFNHRRVKSRGLGARACIEERALARHHRGNFPCEKAKHDGERHQQRGVKTRVREFLIMNFDKTIEIGDGDVSLTLSRVMGQKLIDEGECPQLVGRAVKTCVLALSDISLSKTTLTGKRHKRYHTQFPTRSRRKARLRQLLKEQAA